LLVVVRGLPGSGKSTLASTLAESLSVELLQTDAIRRQLFGSSETPLEYGQGRYRPETRARIYQEMFRRASVLLDASRSVVLDGTFLSADLRSEAAELAKRHGAETLVVRCDCPDDVARERIADRIATGTSLSDSRPDFYERQKEANECDPPDLPVLNVDTTASQPAILETVFAHLRRLLLPATISVTAR
jgi:predicted kinase